MIKIISRYFILLWESVFKKHKRCYQHYYKDVSKLKKIDVYKVLLLWQVTDPCIQHAIKKLLAPGIRGAKSEREDIEEAVKTLKRYIEIQNGE